MPSHQTRDYKKRFYAGKKANYLLNKISKKDYEERQ